MTYDLHICFEKYIYTKVFFVMFEKSIYIVNKNYIIKSIACIQSMLNPILYLNPHQHLYDYLP